MPKKRESEPEPKYIVEFITESKINTPEATETEKFYDHESMWTMISEQPIPLPAKKTIIRIGGDPHLVMDLVFSYSIGTTADQIQLAVKVYCRELTPKQARRMNFRVDEPL